MTRPDLLRRVFALGKELETRGAKASDDTLLEIRASADRRKAG